MSVTCAKCSRFWLNMIGSADGILREVADYTVGFYIKSNPNYTRYDFRTGRHVPDGPGVVVFHDPCRDDAGTVLYMRYRVQCHQRCGVTPTFRWDSFAAEFRDAVEAGHAETGL